MQEMILQADCWESSSKKFGLAKTTKPTLFLMAHGLNLLLGLLKPNLMSCNIQNNFIHAHERFMDKIYFWNNQHDKARFGM